MSAFDVDTPYGLAKPTCIPRPRRAAPGPRSRRRRRRDFPGSGRSDGRGLSEGFSVALEQPYRVAGRRSPRRPGSSTPPGLQWSSTWSRVTRSRSTSRRRAIPGRSVACRTAGSVGASQCFALPSRCTRPAAPMRPAAWRSSSVSVPVLVVQGSRDPFGMPPPGAERTVAQVAGNHSLKAGLPAGEDAVRAWLPRVLALPRRA